MELRPRPGRRRCDQSTAVCRWASQRNLCDHAVAAFVVRHQQAPSLQAAQQVGDSPPRGPLEAADFGFSGQTLGADNALLLIAYSLYQRGLDAHYLSSSSFREDREAIRGWLVRSLLKAGVWGSGLDTLLTAIRATLREQGAARFPVEAVEATMRSRGKGLRFEEEELEDLADVAYGDRRAFPLLSLLFPFHDLRRLGGQLRAVRSAEQDVRGPVEATRRRESGGFRVGGSGSQDRHRSSSHT
ncbi:MAG: hypothetical protein AMXMBFR64_61730 [Myxococcales bacterium]